MRWLAGLLLSLLFSFSLTARFLHLLDRLPGEQAPLLLVPALGFGILIYWVLPFFEAAFRRADYKILLLIQALLAGLVFAWLTPGGLLLRMADFLSVSVLTFALALPASSGYRYIARREHVYTLVVTWMLATLAAFFVAGFLSHSYPPYWAGPLSFLSCLACGLILYGLLRYARAAWKSRPRSVLAGLSILGAASLFAASLGMLAARYPAVFDTGRFILPPQDFGLFFAISMLSPVWVAWALQLIEERGWPLRWARGRFSSFLSQNLPGLVLGAIFASAYTFLSYVFNHPGVDQTENFLAADNFAWMGRLAAADGTRIEMRAVHPFAFFILRPLVWLFSLLFNGDRYTALLLLVPLTGGLCVFLAYFFVRKWSGSRLYAMLAASLLGASTSHLLFASLVESYIFSAAALLLFFVLLLEEKTHWLSLAALGVVIFGITITNFIQAFIGFCFGRPRLKSIFQFGLLASALSIALTALHSTAFPSSLMFFDPAGAGVESQYSIPFFGQPAWRMAGRTELLARNILFYSIVAPRPYILTTEVGGVFPRFNFFRLTPGNYSFSSYHGLSNLVALLWASLALAAMLLFLRKLLRAEWFDLQWAFLFVILFNFG
ncbi:MAG: hypothetical protein ACM3QS_02860, partial [Bacteroidota bacterium]